MDIKIPKIKINIGFNKDNEYIEPKKHVDFLEGQINYKNAEEFIANVKLKKNYRLYSFLSGDFIFGDAIESFFDKFNVHTKKLYICTLSYSQDNIDSLFNLAVWGLVDEINIIVSHYFYGHERHLLIKYAYEKLNNIENFNFQLATCDIHAKIICFELTKPELYFTWYGSSNLRSSDNIEQLCCEENKQIYDFNVQFFDRIIKEFHTINKSIRRVKLWQILGNKRKAQT